MMPRGGLLRYIYKVLHDVDDMIWESVYGDGYVVLQVLMDRPR